MTNGTSPLFRQKKCSRIQKMKVNTFQQPHDVCLCHTFFCVFSKLRDKSVDLIAHVKRNKKSVTNIESDLVVFSFQLCFVQRSSTT